jgi:hypothetical protein
MVMAVIQISKVQVRRGRENQTGVPQLEPGEFGWAEDTENLYIGKRIVDGAVSDQNSRILTDKDLDNIFSIIYGGDAVASTSTYKYRDGVNYIDSVISTVGIKLDTLVSLTDYGVRVSTTPTDITGPLTRAIDNIFFNPTHREDARRELLIPAGNYYINNTIKLPPYTSLRGEGAGITILTMTSNTATMFKTVDAQEHVFESGDMQSGINRAREVSLSDITLQYDSTGTSSTHALLCLDNVLDARVTRVHFQNSFDAASTWTYGLTTYGCGIEMRGSGTTHGSSDVTLHYNSMITDCKFDGMYMGILATGTVMRPIIDRNVFSNLYCGVDFHTEDTQPGPLNGIISKNRFENIVREGIIVGANPNNIPSNHISKENNFVQVGNGLGLDDFVTTSSGTTAVIAFRSSGNESDGDFFNRQALANATTDPDFYYNPLIVGRTSIRSGAAFTATLATSSNTPVAKICLNDAGQMVTIKYQLNDFGLSRKGTMNLNLSSAGYSAVTDTYNFTQGLYIITDHVTTATVVDLDPTQFAIDVSVFTTFDPVSNPGIADGTWYMTGDNVYAGYAATITSALSTGTTGTIVIFRTESADPEFDFNTSGETWKLLQADAPSQEFNLSPPHNNYVELTCSNSSVLTDTLLEFQIDTLL